MSSSYGIEPPPTASTTMTPPHGIEPHPTESARSGEKRKHGRDNDDVDQQSARKMMARKQCIVCAYDVPVNRFPKLLHKQDDGSKHSSEVCFKCCSAHLNHEVKNKAHEVISCPQCSKAFEPHEVQKLVSSRKYQE